VALTHAATLGFLLDLRGGGVRIADSGGLRAHCHRVVATVLRDPAPVKLTAEGDSETGGLAPGAVALAQEWEDALSERLRGTAAARLQGANPVGWDEASALLVSRDLVSDRNA